MAPGSCSPGGAGQEKGGACGGLGPLPLGISPPRARAGVVHRGPIERVGRSPCAADCAVCSSHAPQRLHHADPCPTELRELGYASMRAKRMSYMDLCARNMPSYFSAEQAHPGRHSAANGTGFSWVFGACTSSLRLTTRGLPGDRHRGKRRRREGHHVVTAAL